MEVDRESLRDDEWIGTKLLFENEVVRVWDFHLPPGGSTKMHTHRRDWLYVNVTGDNHLRVDYPNLEQSAFRESDIGDVTFMRIREVDPEKRTHRANNVGQEVMRQVLVEFKNSYLESEKTTKVE